MARDWDSGKLREAMFIILAKYGQDDAKRFGKFLGDDLLNRFFREAFELGWKAGQERIRNIRSEQKVDVYEEDENRRGRVLIHSWTREEFIEYLTETLVPDLKESGRTCTAQDFETAIKFMEG